MTENEPGQEEEKDPTPKKTDPKALAVGVALAAILALLIALNMN
jgi:hypothetical protein